ncbi:MAG TPA: hypothetical protein VMF69_12455 [Gemmataceae bacterium]|nr:hypothetical protein [Gemmataceae bacterium]
MPQESEKGKTADQQNQKTLAEMFCRFPDPRARRELEEFRIKFEGEFGETDITKRYTTQLRKEDQEWLMQHHPKRYWDGLPPFVQEFIRNKVVAAHQVGKLDDMPNEFLRLYLSGQMTVGYGRGKGFQR